MSISKVIIEYNLPDEGYYDVLNNIKKTLNLGAYESCIDEILSYTRSILKHGDPSDEVIKHLEHIRQLIFDEQLGGL
jgi:hypothetical protein